MEPQPYTARRLAGLGFALGAGVALVFTLLAALVGFWGSKSAQYQYAGSAYNFIEQIQRLVLTVVPPAGALGSLLFLGLHRRVNVAHKTKVVCLLFLVGVMMAIAAGLGFVLTALFLWAQERLREIGTGEGRFKRWALPALASLCLLLFLVFVWCRPHHFPDKLALAAALSFVITELVVSTRFSVLERAGLIQPPEKGFRFSLGTLMLLTVSLAAYISMLVNLY